MKYLIMECHPAYAVALSEDGRFLKVANLHYEVGDTVSDVTELSIPHPKEQTRQLHQRKWITSLAALAACLILTITALFPTVRPPHASVYLSINPEVRIDVNRKDIVVGVEGMNEDGIALLADYEYRNKDLDLVVDELVDLAINLGYLHEGGKVTLSLDADDEWIVSHREHLSSQLNDYLTDKLSVTIDIEQRNQPTPVTEPTLPTGPITIPIVPPDYSDTDYGQDDWDDHDDDLDDIDDDRDDIDDDRDDPDDDRDDPDDDRDDPDDDRDDPDDDRDDPDDDWDDPDDDWDDSDKNIPPNPAPTEINREQKTDYASEDDRDTPYDDHSGQKVDQDEDADDDSEDEDDEDDEEDEDDDDDDDDEDDEEEDED